LTELRTIYEIENNSGEKTDGNDKLDDFNIGDTFVEIIKLYNSNLQFK
jgi:hypothetical protein